MLRSRDLAGTYYLPMEYYLLAGAMYLVMAWPHDAWRAAAGAPFRARPAAGRQKMNEARYPNGSMPS